MYNQSFRSMGYSWNNGTPGSYDISSSVHGTATTSMTHGYDPANPGYSASSNYEYINPGYTTFMNSQSNLNRPRHTYSQHSGPSDYGQSYSQNPSGSNNYSSNNTSKREHPSSGGADRRNNPKGQTYKQTFSKKGGYLQNKVNQTPPKSTSARKLAQSSHTRSAGANAVAVKSSETITPDRIIPAKQGSTFFKKPKGKSRPKNPSLQKKAKEEMNGYGSYGRGAYNVYGGGKKNFGGKRRVFKKRDNDHDDIPFPVLIDNCIYESCDHYYQIEKTKQLCGATSEKMTATVRDAEGRRLDGKVGFRSHEEKGFSTLARELIRLNNVPKEKVEEWRHTKGLEVMQKALAAKLSQCPELREALRATGDKILVHCFPGDAIYGSGTRITGIKAWCDEMQKNEGKLMVPMRFPLTQETVQQSPVVGKGRNILGVIMMQLRNQVLSNEVDVKDMSIVFDALRGGPGGDASKDTLDEEGHGFSIGGGSIQPPIGTAL